MKKLIVTLLGVILLVSCGKKYEYESVEGDPMGVRIYTLKNGLKVYTSVNHDEPRIQAFVAVRAGSKNDPLETTGLAHYFEHLMFKGTTHFGTSDYEAEKPLLDSIEALFEVYRAETDSLKRKQIYHQIDSISYEASKISIPNEYDKLMAAIGAEGCNAFTDWDRTCYQEDIPSNQLNNWLKIQADRFENPILRGFHTELETVYEEYNMYASQDDEKASVALMSALFPGHPYGRDIIGLPEHLKNPSITRIKEFFNVWYVPNNIAIILSGDFDPDEAIAAVDKYLGEWKASEDLPSVNIKAEDKITCKDSTVYGLEAENLLMGWRLPEAGSEDSEAIEMMANVLFNGKTGLMDLDLQQQQRVNACGAGLQQMRDYGILIARMYPKQGQSLEELRALVLEEVQKLKDGDFSEEMLEGLINNYKKNLVQQSDNYRATAYTMLESFTSNLNWEDNVKQIDNLSKLTKADIQNVAKKYLAEDDVVTIYKRQSASSNQKKIEKPQLTPIEANRDMESAFLKEIRAAQVDPIKPAFLDFNKDLTVSELQQGVSLLYKQNTNNKLFSLTYLINMGDNQDKALSLASNYMDYLGTSDMTPEQVKEAFFHIACNYAITSTGRMTYITLNGLDENMDEAIKLLEKVLCDAQVNETAYQNLVLDVLKNREDAKKEKNAVTQCLLSYMMYGPKNAYTNLLSATELMEMNPQELVDRIHQLTSFEHRVLYYGPCTEEEITAKLKEEHTLPETLTPVPTDGNYVLKPVDESHVFLVDYDDNQSNLRMYAYLDDSFSVENTAMASLYNNYFGAGSMNCIVFQELRERRSLAYSAYSMLRTPNYKEDRHSYSAVIGTQNDKLMDATEAFTEIIRQMPQSQAAFDLAKDAMLSSLRCNRTTKSSVLWSYVSAQQLGIDYDINERIYEAVQNMTLQDVVAYQQKHIRPLVFDYGVVCRRSDMDIPALSKYGTPVWLTLQDIFGY